MEESCNCNECAEEIITLKETDVVLNDDYKILINKPSINNIELVDNKSLEDLGINIPDVSLFITKDIDDLTNYTLTTDLERDYAKKSEIPDTSNFITDEEVNVKLLDKADKSEIPSLENYYTKSETYSNSEIDDKVDEETRDLLQGLSRELKPDEENGGFSSQTIVNVKNKSGATEMIVEIDNLDIKTNVPVNSVLGTQKAIDMDDRLKKVESKEAIPVIEINTDITDTDNKAHNYPQLTLSKEQIDTILQNNTSILKVTYNVTDTTNDTEKVTLVFYTTIDEINTQKGENIVKTIKINATRTNDEAIIVYHGELLGNGELFYTSVNLTAHYFEFIAS